jgi:anti-sigma regulatory factor (Ser/Thr protein kinase)
MYAARDLRELGWEVFIAQRKNASAAFAAVLRHWEHYQAPKSERAAVDRDLGSYPLRGVISASDMVSELNEWAGCLAQAGDASEEDIALWTTHVSELTTNGFQHGKSQLPAGRKLGPVLLAGSAGRRVGGAQLAVLDTGSGIPAVLRPHLGANFATSHDGKVIAEACRSGVTSRCEKSNQGVGLFSLSKAVKNTDGSLQIVSGNGMAHISHGRMYSKVLAPHPTQHQVLSGTLTVITLKGSKRRPG